MQKSIERGSDFSDASVDHTEARDGDTGFRDWRNMMHFAHDDERMYEADSLPSTLEHAARFYVRLVHIGPDGRKVDPFSNIDLNPFKTGPARGHDMLVN